jgi:cytochrome P450
MGTATASAASRQGSGLPPGPRLPVPVQTLLAVFFTERYTDYCARRFGSLVTLRVTGVGEFVAISDPDVIRQIFTGDPHVMRAGEANAVLGIADSSVVVADGERHLRLRRLLLPAFHGEAVRRYAEHVRAAAAAEVERWPAGRPVALLPRMQAITLEVILRLVFGIADPLRLGRLRALLPELIEAGASPLLWLLPQAVRRRLDASRALRRRPSPLRRFLRLRDEVDALLYAEIAARRAAPDPAGRDVLAQLIAAGDDGDRPMSDAELRDELVTLLEAGHETTATALAWTFERLLRTPPALERLVAEVDAGDEEEYLEAVVREGLRARAVILDTPRILTQPLRLGGYEVPAGWYVAPAMPLVHTAPSAHAEPGAFRPERFLDGEAGGQGWIPFGGGKRHCVGSHLALLELKVIVREVVRAVALEAVDPAPERPKIQHVTLVPSALTMVRVRARRSDAGDAQPAQRLDGVRDELLGRERPAGAVACPRGRDAVDDLAEHVRPVVEHDGGAAALGGRRAGAGGQQDGAGERAERAAGVPGEPADG